MGKKKPRKVRGLMNECWRYQVCSIRRIRMNDVGS